MIGAELPAHCRSAAAGPSGVSASGSGVDAKRARTAEAPKLSAAQQLMALDDDEEDDGEGFGFGGGGGGFFGDFSDGEDLAGGDCEDDHTAAAPSGGAAGSSPGASGTACVTPGGAGGGSGAAAGDTCARAWAVDGKFRTLTAWLHDVPASEHDTLPRALEWMAVARALHAP